MDGEQTGKYPETGFWEVLGGSELHPQLKRDHARRTIAAQANAEQTRRRRGSVRKRSKPCLRSGLSRNASEHRARKRKIRMIEDVEELCIEPQLHPLAQGKRFRKVKVTPYKIGTA
jgi:hypothetical protein